MIKKIFIYFLITMTVLCSAYRKPDKYIIQAEKDAYFHNNLGIRYLEDRIYYAAIQEFKIAINLSPSTQASAIFYNNLGETYMFIGYPDMAKTCFEDAIKLYGLNFKYYLNLCECYKALKITNTKISEFQSSKNVYDKIKLGILYIETNQVRKGVNLLDELCMEEPDLMITPAIRQYLKEIINSKRI